ncbi:mucin-21-like [Haliotis rubra]|uniref:mucin-21-like n=1 Tax=Haliotis rubra TaxID=36100 RepID=UPI001EE50F3D|nr:mucin-21-like [Haliotis rubra]
MDVYNCKCRDVCDRSRHCLIWYFILISGNVCPTTSGEKVVRACEGNFASGDSVYLDTSKAVNYQGNCVCQLRAQGGAVDLQLTVHGVHADCDATLYFPPPIDYNYRCSVKAPSNNTGRIGLGQVIFLTLIKRSEVADFCVHLVQTSTKGGSLNLACSKGTVKSSSPLTTTSSQPNTTTNVVTTSDTSVTESKDLTGGNSTTTTTERKDPSGDNSTTTATESKDSSGDNSTTTATERRDPSGDNSTTTSTESKDPSGDNSTTTSTESNDPSGDNSTTTATASKDSSGDNSTTTATESNDVTGNNSATTVTSGENADITPAEVIGHNNAAPSQSKVTVSFVVVGLVAAISA